MALTRPVSRETLMAEEGKIPLEKEETEKEEKEKEKEEEAEGKDSNPAPVGGDEKREEGEGAEGKVEETEGSNPTPMPEEGEKGGDEAEEKKQANEEADSDSVTVTVAAALPYADAVAGVKADFTMPQLQELEQQTLIYRYMAAAVPVPTHLVFPIWKTVTTSSSSSAGPEQYPTLMGLATLCLDYGKSPEPEPGRCRRTDGKKWRCWRNVVPDQKYCERHLHRGRKRPIQVEILDEPEDALPLPQPVLIATPASAEKGTGEGGSTSKKSKKERASKDADTQVAVPATAAAVKSS